MSTDTQTANGTSIRKPVNRILRRSGHPVAVLVTAGVVIVVLTGVGFLLRSNPVDLALSQTLNVMHTGSFGRLTNRVYEVFAPVPAIALTVVVTGVIWVLSRQLRVAVAFAGVVAVTWIPSDIVKLLVHRPRPDVHLLAHPFAPVQLDPSYPSGHTVFVTAFVLALLFVLRSTRWFPAGVILGTVLIVGVAVPLAIDAVHYPTDVAASVVWSLAVAPAARLIWVDWLMPLVPFLRDPAHIPHRVAARSGS